LVRRTPITPLEEYQIVLLRMVLFLSLDDLVQVVQAKINPKLTRAAINRCLKRCRVDNLDWLLEKIAVLKDRTEYGRKLVDKSGKPLSYKSLSSSYRDFPLLICYEITHHQSNIVFFFFTHPALKMVLHAEVCLRKHLDARREDHKRYLHGISYVVLSAENNKRANIFKLIQDNIPKRLSLNANQDEEELKQLKAHFADLDAKTAKFYFRYHYKWISFYVDVLDFVDELKLPYSSTASRKEEACVNNIFCHLLKSGMDRFPNVQGDVQYKQNTNQQTV
jgi:hypothetical protein